MHKVRCLDFCIDKKEMSVEEFIKCALLIEDLMSVNSDYCVSFDTPVSFKLRQKDFGVKIRVKGEIS